MSEKLKESLSAVVDDEADEFELRRVLDELVKDPALKENWERYHLIGTVLRDERGASGVLRERVWRELSMAAREHADNEADTGLPGIAEPPRSRLGRRWSSVAIAAGVAAAVVIGVGNFTQPDAVGPPVASTGVELSERQAALEQAVALKAEATESDEQRIDAYKIFHTQQRGMNQLGPGAFTKMVTYQRQ